MFPLPEIIETIVFARVPDALRRTERTSPFFDGRPFAETHSFLEGPSFDRAGYLYCVDMAWGRIFRIAPDGTFAVVAQYDGIPNGLRIHRDGRIFIADRARGLMVMEPGSGAVRCVAEGPSGARFRGLNDLIFAKNGDLYFTDQGETGIEDPVGSVYCMRTDGRLDHVLGDIPGPNGLALNADDSVLYLNVSRLNQVWTLPFASNGRPKKVSVFLQLSGSTGGPDGIAVDEQGGVAVAHSGMGCVWVFSRLGEPLYRLKSCAGMRTTNIAYGGEGNRTLFITESQAGTILQAQLPVGGQQLYSHC